MHNEVANVHIILSVDCYATRQLVYAVLIA